jgi:Ni/Fe-hydrogenase subunit HybB-like protein
MGVLDNMTQDYAYVLQTLQGHIYPNEVETQWGILIVMYPYITGLVAGAFIVASLERIFKVKELKPTYRLALLTAFAFLIVAPMPLLSHLGHPLRGFQIFLTPHLTSAMAAFGFVYLWYLLAVLCLEIWYDYRKDFVERAQKFSGLKGAFYKALTLGVQDVSEDALKSDEKIGYIITFIGLPSAILLHGYVGFIFGSVKANPWWASPLMPIIFLFSAMVSGIGLLILIYMVSSWLRKVPIDMRALDSLGAFLLYITLLDFGLESMEVLHMYYVSEESIDIIRELISSKIFVTYVGVQMIMGTLVPLAALTIARARLIGRQARKMVYLTSSVLVMIGVFAMRWNVVVGGQLFSKSLYGFKIYDMEVLGREGVLMAAFLFILAFIILYVLLRVLPPWVDTEPKPEY